MTGSGAVLTLVLIEWAAGWIGVAAWTQSWGVVRRGHFRITAWITAALALMALLANFGAAPEDASLQRGLIVTLFAASLVYLGAQYVRSDLVGAVVGGVAAVVGAAGLVEAAGYLEGGGRALTIAGLLAGAGFLGSITNGMMLGHWYLNQPGLKPWALARLTLLALAGVGLTLLTGAVDVGRLTEASTEGAVLGLPGFGDSFGVAFYGIWFVLAAFSGGVVWMARRCIQIRSIQSATGLYYVAILTSGVAEFLVRYLMVNAT